jgi:hypothetical protein
MFLLLLACAAALACTPGGYAQTRSPQRAPAKELARQKQPPRAQSAARPAAESHLSATEAHKVLNELAISWSKENLSALLEAFGERRVAIDVGSVAKAGEFGPTQERFLFKRIFARTETRTFILKRYRPNADAPHAVFDWRYVDEKSGGLRRVRLVVSLRREAGSWVIDEIRSASRSQ